MLWLFKNAISRYSNFLSDRIPYCNSQGLFWSSLVLSTATVKQLTWYHLQIFIWQSDYFLFHTIVDKPQSVLLFSYFLPQPKYQLLFANSIPVTSNWSFHELFSFLWWNQNLIREAAICSIATSHPKIDQKLILYSSKRLNVEIYPMFAEREKRLKEDSSLFILHLKHYY